ncbi:hypothetical protein K505DRAFT_330077 [Melanomma pulvis-pyrius CBS 109.77]|uniref:Uncharacterized protein n=1 Tax=Melanomma pulvis-pyrius CBS 109.77 TaxID=1314802 RepID=A0A6A6WSD2_9PLEO|nr:hypothetical protein K505DRAFT_330077 [Melanomma pulvis-pyrius CBS 109.77]
MYYKYCVHSRMPLLPTPDEFSMSFPPTPEQFSIHSRGYPTCPLPVPARGMSLALHVVDQEQSQKGPQPTLPLSSLSSVHGQSMPFRCCFPVLRMRHAMRCDATTRHLLRTRRHDKPVGIHLGLSPCPAFRGAGHCCQLHRGPTRGFRSRGVASETD